LWGRSGSGKTFFVKQLTETLSQKADYFEFNLAEITESEARSNMAKLTGTDRPFLSLIDEVDSKPSESWPYEILLQQLDPAQRRKHNGTFVLAGSSGSSIEEMKLNIASHWKGPDLLSRIPLSNQYEIPPITPGDKILVALATMKKAAKEAGRDILEVEKLALYYIASSPKLENPRQLREFALAGLERIPKSEDRVKFDHLFSPGDQTNKLFWVEARKTVPRLVNSYLRLDD
jgi:hypothetical protein